MKPETCTRKVTSRLLGILFFSLLFVHSAVLSAAGLTVTPITWNVLGLDSNNVTTGPSEFPVGIRVCDISGAGQSNVVADFVWDSASTYIDLRPGSLNPITLASLAASACSDFYFEVQVARDANAYDTQRRFHIEVTSDTETTPISSPVPRELYIEKLVSQNRNAVDDLKLDGVSVAAGGDLNLTVGKTYDITLLAHTAPGGYEQLETFLTFPNTIFQLNSVAATYTQNAGTDALATTKLYADGCTWDSDPTSGTYKSCLGSGNYGADITISYNVTVIGGAGTSETLNTLIYDRSGASFHYNSDYSSSSRIAVISSSNPAMTLDKTGVFNDDGTTDGLAQVGETISYSLVVNNTGDVTLNNIVVSDPVAGTVTCPSGNPIPSLAVGISETCTGSYTLVQADIDAGQKDNSASATSDEVGPVTDTATTILPKGPGLSLTKSGSFVDGNTNGLANVGETINYSFVVSNTGNVTLTNVSISDPVAGTLTCPSGNPIPSLAVGASETCAGSYTLVQADIDAGQKDNSASATSNEVGPVTDTATTILPKGPGLSLTKSGSFVDGNTNGLANVGETINYSFVVSNTGNVTLTNVSVSDPVAGTLTCPSGNPIPSLAVGASETCTGSYTLVQADIDAGQKDNTASATSDEVGPVTDTATTILPNAPGLSLIKSGAFNDGNGSGLADVGETIDYSFEVRNTGNVTLNNVAITDPIAGTVTCPSGNPIPSLAVDAAQTCTGSYTLVQADIDAGEKVNTATADSDETGPVQSTETTKLPTAVGLSLVKTGNFIDDNANGLAELGETISYRFAVTNTGSVTLTNVSVTDSVVSGVSCPSGNPIPTLAVGASETCTGSYPLIQVDIDAGQKINTASATSDQTTPVQNTETTALPTTTDLTLVKNGAFNDANSNGLAEVGETIDYTFILTNAGGVTLTNVSVTDSVVGGVSCPSGNPVPTLAVGASETCTGSYTLVQTDIDAGEKINTATGDSDQTASVNSTETTKLPTAVGLSLVKAGSFNDANNDGLAEVGETIDYGFTLANTGSITLTNVTVSDAVVGAITCPSGNPIPSLPVGASETCTGSYTLVQVDVDTGQKVNTAAADSDQTGTVENTETTPLPTATSLALQKSGSFNDTNSSGFAEVGEFIDYAFAVTNSGSVALTNVSITDAVVGTVTCPSGNPIPSLAVGASETCTGSYTLVQADIDAGQKINTATADSDQTGPVQDTATTVLLGTPGLSLVKSGIFNDTNMNGFAEVGETIDYAFVVTNTGSTTLTNIAISDPLVGTVTCPSGNPIASLAVGTSETCAGSYTLVQADIDAGQKDNTASAKSDQTGTVQDTTTVTLTVDTTPVVEAVKISQFDPALHDRDGDGQLSPGDDLFYRVTISNLGPVDAIDSFYDDIPDANTALIVGSVTTSQGSVATGNGGSDTMIRIDMGTLAVGSPVEVTYLVRLDNPMPVGVDRIENQGSVSGGNFPSVLTDANDGTPSSDDSTVTLLAPPALAVQPVPTLNQWGLILLGLLMALTTLVGTSHRRGR